MPSLHHQLVDQAAAPVLFATLGELWSYTPAGGQARDVLVIPAEAGPETEEEDYVERSREEIWFTCRRDASHADGGIDAPALGDELLRSGDTVPYTFQNQVRARTSETWQLKFARAGPEAYRPESR